MSDRKSLAASVLALLMGLPAAEAAAPASGGNKSDFGIVAGMSVEFGGDEIAELVYSDGGTQSVKAGDGVGIALGLHYRFANSPFDLSATIGKMGDITSASNGDIETDRWVYEAMASYIGRKRFWAGLGLISHRKMKFTTDGLGTDLSFDNSTGLILKAGWRWIGVQMARIDYKVSAPFTGKVNGNNFGVFLMGRF